MKKSKKEKKNLAEALNDEELKDNAELAFKDNSDSQQGDFDDKEKPILSEEELKVRKAKRTRVAVAAFVLLLGVGVLGNWYFENSDFSATVKPLISSSDTKTLGEAEYVDATASPENIESSYFSEARMNRETARDEAIEKLQEVIDKTDESEAAKAKASEELSRISQNISIENKIETLVAAKGAKNVLAVINNDASRVDVIVDVDELDDNTILQIKEIAMQQLGCSFEAVSIIQSKAEANENSTTEQITEEQTKENSD